MRVRLVPIGMALALAAGAATAVMASGAGGGNKITIVGNPGDKITIQGSRLDDTITYGGYTSGVTVAANRAITSQRADCDVNELAPENAFCSRQKGEDYKKLDTRLGKGPDSMEFFDSFDSPGFRILGSGGKGGDTLAGTETRDEFSGGGGNDGLFTYEGDDDLDGGRGSSDACDGGPGTNEIRRCESLR